MQSCHEVVLYNQPTNVKSFIFMFILFANDQLCHSSTLQAVTVLKLLFTGLNSIANKIRKGIHVQICSVQKQTIGFLVSFYEVKTQNYHFHFILNCGG